MSVLLELISRYIIWIYAACGLVILAAVRSLWLAGREQGQATFVLEREQAVDRMSRSLLTMLSMLAVMGMVYLTDRYVTPLVSASAPGAQPVASPTEDQALVVPTHTPSPTPLTPAPTPRSTVTPSPTPIEAPSPTPTPLVTQSPEPPAPTPTPVSGLAFPPRSCPHPGAQISAPANGSRVSGTLAVQGTADIGDDFQFYKVEWGSGFDPQSWSVIEDLRRQAVRGGILVHWSAGMLPPGPYTLKLRVVDRTGNWVDDCWVHVEVVR